MKTYQQWSNDPQHRTMTQFLEIGDEVDHEFIDYALGVLPPAAMTAHVVQIGEPFSHSPKGFPTFITFEWSAGVWTYTGTKTHSKHGFEPVELARWSSYIPEAHA